MEHCVLLGIIIIMIERGRQCKAGRERSTPYQSKDPSPTIPTYKQKKEKWKKSRRRKGIELQANKKA